MYGVAHVLTSRGLEVPFTIAPEHLLERYRFVILRHRTFVEMAYSHWCAVYVRDKVDAKRLLSYREGGHQVFQNKEISNGRTVLRCSGGHVAVFNAILCALGQISNEEIYSNVVN